MLKWLKNKVSRGQPDVPPLVKEFVRTKALAAAITQVMGKHHEALKAGRKTSPAFMRPLSESSALDIWADTRMDALSSLWGHGASDIFLLGDHIKQKALIDALFEQTPHLEYPHKPTGDPIHDTLQAVFQVYVFLGTAGNKVFDEATSKHSLDKIGKSIFSEFEAGAQELRPQVGGFHPHTLLDVLFKDVTKKAKTIALTSRFGPDFEGNLNEMFSDMRNQMRTQGQSDEAIDKELASARAAMDKVLAADDPDHVSRSLR